MIRPILLALRAIPLGKALRWRAIGEFLEGFALAVIAFCAVALLALTMGVRP